MPEHTAAAERTRRAVLEAGIEVLASNPSAPLSEIAAKAGVSRSTFHRYFSDRSALKKAAGELAVEAWHTAVERAGLTKGTGLEAYRRLCTELMDSLPALIWWMTQDAPEDHPEGEEIDRNIAAMLQRGQEDGSIDPQLSIEWISNSVWAMLYAVYYIPIETPEKLGRFEARQQALRALMKAAAADPSSV
ncbi:TetR/AcrR family transcriptional regulator [Nesterenkonia ebinurensis]|uniref:TetR/AcrR family transcriptional regulator n=1 Tax=Nesterenkonia ebinurensis TaxID=2608252 RepID=UPI00123DE894|nr:TetR/AcrR family transcriptional regulator [Nesterenkonia ebinurensis]